MQIPLLGRVSERIPFWPSEQDEVTPVERWIARKVLAADGAAPLSVLLWNGEEVGDPGPEPVGTIHVNDRFVLYELLRNPDMVVGDAYVDGRIEVEGDLIEVLESSFRARNGSTPLAVTLARYASLPRINTLTRSRQNVHHHYDVGNDFYSMWLDEELVYTCAYFENDEATLEQAQIAKMEHVCRKLRLEPGDRVIEAGCGWGSLAIYMAKNYDVKIRAFNVSTEQVRYAKERAKRLGIESQVEFIEDDYRNVSGKYDVFVSVGMLEHVGKAHYATLGRVIDKSLRQHGRGLLHSIGRSTPSPMNPWIERRIFPGAHIPSLREMLEVLEVVDLQVNDVENLRLHYARTLENWLERFEEHAEEIEEMYDEAFYRTYQLYLASSSASFLTGGLHLYQVAFTRPDYNDIPWTRHYIYEK